MFKAFRNLNLGIKIGGGFTLLLIIAAVMAFMGYSGLINVEDKAIIAMDAVGFAETALEMRQNEKDFMLRKEKIYIDNINSLFEDMNKQVEETRALMTDQVDKERLTQMYTFAGEYSNAANNYADSLFQQNELRSKFINTEEDLNIHINTILTNQEEEYEQALEELTKIEEEIVSEFAENYLPTFNYLLNADRDFQQSKVALMKAVNENNRGEIEQLKGVFDENIAQTAERFEKYENTDTIFAEEIEIRENFYTGFQTYKTKTSQIWDNISGGNYNNLDSLLEQENQIFGEVREKLDKIQQKYMDASNSLQQETDTNIETTLNKVNQKYSTRKLANDLKANINEIGIQERNYIINLANAEMQSQYADSTLAAFETAKSTAAELRDSFNEAQDIEAAENIIAQLENTEQVFREIHNVELVKDENKALLEEKAEEFIVQANSLKDLHVEEMHEAQSTAIRNLIIALVIAVLIGIILAFFITRSITKPVNLGVAFAKEIADGNLAAEKIDVDSNDEIGTLAKALNTMQDQLRNVITNVSNIAENLSASSEELSASGEEVAVAAQQVGESIQQVASGAEEQSAQVEETNSKINELIEQINDVEKMSTEMDEQADNVMNNINEGNQSVDNSVEQIENVKGNTKDVANTINNLGDLSNKIGEIVELINDIAAQTNLLALNAAIEAARAGEAGRGFSVVADEIRQLAEESEEATTQIGGLVKEIQGGVGDAVNKMNNTEEVVDSSVSAIKNTGNTFEKINNAALRLSELIENISQQSERVNVNSREVEATVQEIARVSEEAASNSEEVAAASEEQSASTEEIVSAAENLADMANNLTEAVNKFKL